MATAIAMNHHPMTNGDRKSFGQVRKYARIRERVSFSRSLAYVKFIRWLFESLIPFVPFYVHVWPEGFAQLTKIGKQQHYALGQYFRERYAKLLGNGDYSVDKVFVHSTVRCKKLKFKEQKSNLPPFFFFVWMILGHRSYINVGTSMLGITIPSARQSSLEYKAQLATRSGLFFVLYCNDRLNSTIAAQINKLLDFLLGAYRTTNWR